MIVQRRDDLKQTAHVALKGASRLSVVAWAALMSVLTIDNRLAMRIADYDLRASYFCFVVLALSLGVEFFWGDAATRRTVRAGLAFDRRSALYAVGWGLMAVAGAIGVVGAFAQAGGGDASSRSLLFWIWSMGTIGSLPMVATVFARLHPREFRRGWTALLAVLVGVTIFDGLSCYAHAPWGFIGRVFSPEMLCRPHAAYQEPNYLAGFLMLAIPVALSFGTFGFWRRALLGGLVVAVVVAASRAAWAGLALGTALSFVWTVRRGAWRQAGIILAGAGAILGALGVLWITRTHIHEYATLAFRAATGSAPDQSLSERRLAGDAALSVWRTAPIFGVGPGRAGAVFVSGLPELNAHPYHGRVRPEVQRRDPLSKDLITEVLAEWGVLGLFGLFLIIFAITTGLTGVDRLWFIAAYAVVLISSQTLARFDLWWALSALWVSSRIEPQPEP